MLSVIRFCLNCIVTVARMLFTVNIGDGLNLGLLMCILFIFLPITLRVFKLIRQDAIEELDDEFSHNRLLHRKENERRKKK